MKSEKNKKIFASKLKACRTQAKYTQKILATKLGLTTYQAVQKYEDANNDVFPSMDKLIQIAELFDVSIDWLLGLSDEPVSAAEPEPPPELTADQHLDRAVALLLGDVSDTAKDELRTILKSKIYEQRQSIEHNELLKQIANNARSPAQPPADSDELRKAQGG